MDLDAYTAAHKEEWERLDALGRKGTFSGAEADEMIDRYQAGATQLSAIKTSAGSTVVGDRLSVELSRVRLRFTAASVNMLSQLPRFFVLHLPAALYRIRWLTLAVAVVSVIIAVLYGRWALENPQVLANLGSDAELKKLADGDFVSYYSENPAASFFGRVWTNNAWLAAQCIAFGIVGVWVPSLVIGFARDLGITGAIMFQYDQGDVFFLYIAPHGQLELTSVFVAAAAGLRIFWGWVAPGQKTRLESLAHEGRALVTVGIGLIFSLLVAAVIEAFVTPADWPWPVKIGIGSVALAAFLAYMLILGRRAHRAGETGDLDEFEAGARRLIAG